MELTTAGRGQREIEMNIVFEIELDRIRELHSDIDLHLRKIAEGHDIETCLRLIQRDANHIRLHAADALSNADAKKIGA